ncbi:glycosyltransferase family 2 protein [Paenibacillus vandeheii]
MTDLVSIIIRTTNRPTLLKRALSSLCVQTCQNFEVIIIEDGSSSSYYIVKEFDLLDIKYYSTGSTRIGRAKAANLGMNKSSGHFLNFLDDDDYLLPSHIDTLLQEILLNKSCAVYAGAIERKQQLAGGSAIRSELVPNGDIIKNTFSDKRMIYFYNPFPIQAVMFKKCLFEEYGGMDETLEYLEDWDLWIKYSFFTEYQFINGITSVYHVPQSKISRIKRNIKLKKYEKKIISKYYVIWNGSGFKRLNAFQRIAKELKDKGFRKTLFKIFRKIFF